MVFGSQYHRVASSIIELAIHFHSLFFKGEIILHNAIVIISGPIVVKMIMIVLQCDIVVVIVIVIVVILHPTAVLKMVQEISYFMLAPPSLGKANHSDKTCCRIFLFFLQRLCVMSLVASFSQSFHKT